MSQNQQQGQSISIDEFIQIKRNQIVLSYDKAKETALRSFDDIIQLYSQTKQRADKLEESVPKDKKMSTEHQPEVKAKITTKKKK